MTTFLTTNQVAALLGVSPRRVAKMCQDGVIPAVKIGRDWMISEDDLNNFEKRGPGRPRGEGR